jgi:hypothetical protein
LACQHNFSNVFTTVISRSYLGQGLGPLRSLWPGRLELPSKEQKSVFTHNSNHFPKWSLEIYYSCFKYLGETWATWAS